MTPVEFFQTEETRTLMERAATAAGVPVSLHYIARNQEGPKIAGWGQCEACRHVHTLPNGPMACRFSRVAASTMALSQDRPMPFVCHLGFACVAAPALPEEGFVLTFGPYCPMEEQQSLEDDILRGLESLTGEPQSELALSLQDVHRAPATSIPGIAAWTVDTLRDAWRSASTHEEAHADTETPDFAPAPSRRASTPGVSGPAIGEDLAAALTAGSMKRARALLIGALEEMGETGRRSPDARRARVVSMVADALEALVRAGVPGAAAWTGLPDFVATLSASESNSEMANEAVRAFAFLRGARGRNDVQQALPDYPELYETVKDRLVEGITLEEVARRLGQTPSAISHRLKRKFGMSFSTYMARLRTDRAKALFRHTDLAPGEVARRVGIDDQSNFARLFKKLEGMTPAAYRKKHGKRM